MIMKFCQSLDSKCILRVWFHVIMHLRIARKIILKTKLKLIIITLYWTPARPVPIAIGQNTKKLFLTGEIFNVDEAATLNLIDKFVSTKDIINERNILIDKLLLGGPKAQEAIKSYLQNIYSKSISDDVIKYAAENIAELRVSEEGQKGIKAFLNKSNPDWQK